MFSGQNSMIFLGEMLKSTDETIVTSRTCERDSKRLEIPLNEDQPKSKRLVLKFTKCYSDSPTLYQANQEDLQNELERRHEWKVSFPSSIQTTTIKENAAENKTNDKNASADKDIFFTLIDVSDPWIDIKEKQVRRLKVKEVAEVCEPYYNCGENRSKVQSKLLSNPLFVVGHKSYGLKKSKSVFTDYKAALKRLRSYQTLRNQTSTVVRKEVSPKPLFVVGRKTPCSKNHKNSFKDYIACKAGLKRFTTNRNVIQNQISKSFQLKTNRKKLRDINRISENTQIKRVRKR